MRVGKLTTVPLIRIRKKFPIRLVVICFAIAIPMYSWIAYSNGAPLNIVIIVAAVTCLGGAGACLISARMIKRYGGRAWPDDQHSRPNSR